MRNETASITKVTPQIIKISFMPSTQYFSRYCITMEEKMKLLEQNDDELLYSDYSENAFLTYDSNIKAKYLAIQEKIKFY